MLFFIGKRRDLDENQIDKIIKCDPIHIFLKAVVFSV